MPPVEIALLTALIPFFSVWIAVFNRFFTPSKTLNSYIQAIAAGFITGSLLLELMPRLLQHGLNLSYIAAFVIGFVFMLLIQSNEASCCSGKSTAHSLFGFLLPFIIEFIITAMLIGIAAGTKTSLIYLIAISFGLCNFVCGLSISSRFTKKKLSNSARIIVTFLLTAIFPIISVLTVVLISYVTETLLNELIAFAIASLLYLVVMELLPEALALNKKRAASLFFSSITVVFVLTYLLAVAA